MSLFVTIEGIEGAGKSTLIDGISKQLTQQGLPITTTREPGGTPLGKTLRSLLLSLSELRIDPLAELLLFSADRAQHLSELIRPALEAGHIVLCDRFVDSTIAYQGYGRGLDLKLLQKVGEIATQGLAPDLTFLLDLPPDTGLTRTKTRQPDKALGTPASNADRFETEAVDFHRRIRAGFLELAKAHPQRIVTLDGTRSPATLVSQAVAEIEARRLASKGQ